MIQFLFGLFAAAAAGSALMMVTRKSPMASALWLIGTFFALAAIYTLLTAYFIGIIQILVYAGAIMVLFLFVIMLLNLGNQYEPDLRGNLWKALGGGSALVMLALLGRFLAGTPGSEQAAEGALTLAAQQTEYGVVGAIGLPMYTDYVVHLQVTGVLLLIAVVGAVVLAKRNV
jgi:NADH-quinone oxidoreductase subunit J